MASKFMVKKDPIKIELNYIESNGEIVIIRGDDMKKSFANDLKTLKATFLRPNNKLFNLCVMGCVKVNDLGITYLDKSLYNDKRFRMLFVEAIDGDGEKITNSPADIDSLSNDLIINLLEEFDGALDKEKFDVLKNKGYLDENGNLKLANTEEKK